MDIGNPTMELYRGFKVPYIIIQRFQNKMLRKITAAPWYMCNEQLHCDLNKHIVKQVASRLAVTYKYCLHYQAKLQTIQILEESRLGRLQKKCQTGIA